MNIPPVKLHSPFNLLIESENILDDDIKNSKETSNLSCNENDLRLIQNILNENIIEEEEECEECENSIEEKNHDHSIQNNDDVTTCNIDFEKMDLSEIDNEIEKVKETINANEQLYQQRMQEIQKMKEASEKVILLKRKAMALYNEMFLWSQNELKSKYPDVNIQNQLPDPKDVYQNSSKDPDSISDQILIYYNDVKKCIKRK